MGTQSYSAVRRKLLFAQSQSYCMLFTQKTYQNDPQSLLINVITMKLHHMTVR